MAPASSLLYSSSLRSFQYKSEYGDDKVPKLAVVAHSSKHTAPQCSLISSRTSEGLRAQQGFRIHQREAMLLSLLTRKMGRGT